MCIIYEIILRYLFIKLEVSCLLSFLQATDMLLGGVAGLGVRATESMDRSPLVALTVVCCDRVDCMLSLVTGSWEVTCHMTIQLIFISLNNLNTYYNLSTISLGSINPSVSAVLLWEKVENLQKPTCPTC